MKLLDRSLSESHEGLPAEIAVEGAPEAWVSRKLG